MAIEQVIDLLVCPLCAGGLRLDLRQVRCVSGHTFDVARQGYLNLSGRGTPRNADTSAMVAARERFLAGGYYEAIAGAVLDAVDAAHRAGDDAETELRLGAEHVRDRFRARDGT